jgi:hypothetical protein
VPMGERQRGSTTTAPGGLRDSLPLHASAPPPERLRRITLVLGLVCLKASLHVSLVRLNGLCATFSSASLERERKVNARAGPEMDTMVCLCGFGT